MKRRRFGIITMSSRRIVVTGIGIIAPVGVGHERVWNAFAEGRSGITAIDSPAGAPPPTTPTIAGSCRDFQPLDFFTEREMLRLNRASQMSLAAANLAFSDAGITVNMLDNYDTGVILGTGFGGQESIEDSCEAFFMNKKELRTALAIPKSMYSASAANISIQFKIRGPNITLSTACSSGSNAIGIGMHMIRHGQATRVIAGGVDAALTPVVTNAWKEMRVLSTEHEHPERACKPFSANRDGLVMAEGVALVVLEEMESAVERGATIYAEALGYGSTTDAGHITMPDPEGEAQAIRRAISDAGIAPEEIDYINAHGTATKLNDMSETEAIKRVFGKRAYDIPVSATKSMIGHSMGACGAIGFVAAMLALKKKVIPPTINYETPDPQCDLDYVIEGARHVRSSTPLRTAMANSFGFGGNNAVLVLREFDG